MKKSAIGFKPSFNFIALAVPQEMYPKSSAVLQKKEVWKQGVEQNLGGRLSEKLTVAVVGDKVEDVSVNDVVLLNGGCRVQLIELEPISDELVLISDGAKVPCPQLYLIVRETDLLGKFD